MSATATALRPRPVPLSTPRPTPRSLAVPAVFFALIAAGVWSVIDLGINPSALVQSVDNAVAFTSRMFPLDFPSVGELTSMVAETLSIVFLATALSVILSVPLALAAAATTRGRRVNQATARAIIVTARAIPDLILAILFVRVFGLGAIAGILAMGIHSIGMVGKLYADAIEELDDGPRMAAAASGADRRQQLWVAIPQRLMPQIIATALHRFDINLRTSVLLGYVGVGGLGMAIADSIRVLDYQRGMALALVVLILCIITELISGTIRSALLKKADSRGPRTWVDVLRERISGQPTGTRQKGRAAQSSRASGSTLPPWTADHVRRVLSVAAVGLLLVAAWGKVDISMSSLVSSLSSLPSTLALFVPPSTGGIGQSLVLDLLVTVEIAFAATLLGAVIALPVGVLAAGNVVAHKVVHGFFRGLIVVIRGIPELILAVIFVVISGLGPVAGTLALALGAVGLLSKLIADSIEETDVDVQDAIHASGASKIQVFFSATFRQAAPSMVAHTMYLLDTNIRSATLLGVVGAGGIGFQLLNAARVNQFQTVTFILLLIVAVVFAIEMLSRWMRTMVR